MKYPKDLDTFKESLSQSAPNPEWPDGLKALWHDGRGDWEASHDVAQDMPGSVGSRIHGYLHRKEGDRWNAGYWYRRAGCEFPDSTLEEEWDALVRLVLSPGGA